MMDSMAILDGLGGRDNIASIESCISRLRVVVHDRSKVNADELRRCGALGVVVQPGAIHVILGPVVDGVYRDIADELGIEES